MRMARDSVAIGGKMSRVLFVATVKEVSRVLGARANVAILLILTLMATSLSPIVNRIQRSLVGLLQTQYSSMPSMSSIGWWTLRNHGEKQPLSGNIMVA